MQLKGKRKFTATGMGFLTSMVNTLVTSGLITQQAADPIIQVLGVVVPIAGSLVYSTIQGSVDKDEQAVEKVKAIQQATPQPVAVQPSVQVPTPQPAPETPLRTVDWEEFNNRVKGKTELFKAEDKPPAQARHQAIRIIGKKVVSDSLDDVCDYALLYLDAAENRFHEVSGQWYSQMEKELEKNGYIPGSNGCNHTSIEVAANREGYRVAYRNLMDARRHSGGVHWLAYNDAKNTWRSKVSSPYDTLFWVMELAEQLSAPFEESKPHLTIKDIG